MQLKTHIYPAVAVDPRLQRLIEGEFTPKVNWEQVAEDAGDVALSSGKAALGGVCVERFDRLDGPGQAMVRDIITAATDEIVQAESAVLEGE